MTRTKPRLSLLRIVEMNIGFLGLQFSFGLQQSNMGPIYSYLGADEATMPLLWLAGPMTGLLVQPIVGALSDRTVTRIGRRTPYFLIGAVLCSLCLFAMPYSPALWIAASLLWVLDAANNVTMEPYRAYVGDRLADDQRSLGFLTQSAFTGLAQTLSYLAPSLLVFWGMDRDVVDANGIPEITRIAFVIGAVLSLSTILWSVLRVPELPLEPQEIRGDARAALVGGIGVRDIRDAIVEMPPAMRQLGLAMLCQWYAMFAYWQFIAFAVGRSLFDTADAASAGFREAALVVGQIGAAYNAVAFVAALALGAGDARAGGQARPRRLSGRVGAGDVRDPVDGDQSDAVRADDRHRPWLGEHDGQPYVMLTDAIPPERYGVYMGIFNMFIVVPMMIESLTVPLFYDSLLGGDPRNILYLAGVLMLVGGIRDDGGADACPGARRRWRPKSRRGRSARAAASPMRLPRHRCGAGHGRPATRRRAPDPVAPWSARRGVAGEDHVVIAGDGDIARHAPAALGHRAHRGSSRSRRTRILAHRSCARRSGQHDRIECLVRG